MRDKTSKHLEKYQDQNGRLFDVINGEDGTIDIVLKLNILDTMTHKLNVGEGQQE